MDNILSDWKEFVDNLTLPDGLSKDAILNRMLEANIAGKNPYATALGMLGGLRGGPATATSMPANKRQDRGFVASMAAKVKKGHELNGKELKEVKRCRREHGWKLDWLDEVDL